MKSKPPSATSATKQPLEGLTVFLDADCSSLRLQRALEAEGVEVARCADLYEPCTADEVWLEDAGREGWLVVTRDKNIRTRKKKPQRQAVIRHAVRMLVLTGGHKLSGPAMASLVLGAVGDIDRLVCEQEPPFIAGLSKSGLHVYELEELD